MHECRNATGVAVHRYLLIHALIGFLLIPPVLLKLGSVGYRFARYYIPDPSASLVPGLRAGIHSPSGSSGAYRPTKFIRLAVLEDGLLGLPLCLQNPGIVVGYAALLHRAVDRLRQLHRPCHVGACL